MGTFAMISSVDIDDFCLSDTIDDLKQNSKLGLCKNLREIVIIYLADRIPIFFSSKEAVVNN